MLCRNEEVRVSDGVTYLRELSVESVLNWSLRRYFRSFFADVSARSLVNDSRVVLDNLYFSKHVINQCLKPSVMVTDFE